MEATGDAGREGLVRGPGWPVHIYVACMGRRRNFLFLADSFPRTELLDGEAGVGVRSRVLSLFGIGLEEA